MADKLAQGLHERYPDVDQSVDQCRENARDEPAQSAACLSEQRCPASTIHDQRWCDPGGIPGAGSGSSVASSGELTQAENTGRPCQGLWPTPSERLVPFGSVVNATTAYG